MASQLEAGFVVRRMRPSGTDAQPPFTLEQTPGRGFFIVSGARKGFRLHAVNNNVDTPLEMDLHDGMTFPCKFDSLKLTTTQTDAQLHGTDNEGDDGDLIVAIFSDQRVVANIPSREGWIRRTDVVTVQNQSINPGATYTVFNDVPYNETSSAGGQGFTGSPWVDRQMIGSSDPNGLGTSFVRPLLLKPTFGFATSSGIVTAPEWAVFAYNDRDNPGAGEWMYERGVFAGPFTYGATVWWFANGNRLGSAALQHGVLWPARGGRFEIRNNDVAALLVRGFFGFVGAT